MAQHGPAEQLGPMERLGAGRAAEVFAWAPGVVVKLVREPRFNPALEREAASLEAAAAAGIPVPRPLGFVIQEGRRGLLMERVDGKDIFSLIEVQPWRAWSLGRLLGRLHKRMGTATAPGSVARLRDRANWIIEESVHVPGDARGRLKVVLDAASDGDQLCHMDFHPGNVMLARQGAFIIDFPNALRGSRNRRSREVMGHPQGGKASTREGPGRSVPDRRTSQGRAGRVRERVPVSR